MREIREDEVCVSGAVCAERCAQGVSEALQCARLVHGVKVGGGQLEELLVALEPLGLFGEHLAGRRGGRELQQHLARARGGRVELAGAKVHNHFLQDWMAVDERRR